jgi:hypothetical protein
VPCSRAHTVFSPSRSEIQTSNLFVYFPNALKPLDYLPPNNKAFINPNDNDSWLSDIPQLPFVIDYLCHFSSATCQNLRATSVEPGQQVSVHKHVATLASANHQIWFELLSIIGAVFCCCGKFHAIVALTSIWTKLSLLFQFFFWNRMTNNASQEACNSTTLNQAISRVSLSG